MKGPPLATLGAVQVMWPAKSLEQTLPTTAVPDWLKKLMAKPAGRLSTRTRLAAAWAPLLVTVIWEWKMAPVAAVASALFVTTRSAVGTAAAITVPVRLVTSGVLGLSNTTVKRPPDVVTSRLSVMSLAGATPPLLRTGVHAVPSK